MPEAWEVIAGELPPGHERDLSGEIVGPTGLKWGSDAGAVWGALGVSRRAYAELIAPQRVCEGAKAYCKRTGLRLEGLTFSNHNGARFYLTFSDEERRFLQGRSFPQNKAAADICTAALVAIEALGGDDA